MMTLWPAKPVSICRCPRSQRQKNLRRVPGWCSVVMSMCLQPWQSCPACCAGCASNPPCRSSCQQARKPLAHVSFSVALLASLATPSPEDAGAFSARYPLFCVGAGWGSWGTASLLGSSCPNFSGASWGSWGRIKPRLTFAGFLSTECRKMPRLFFP